jgi:mRNA-degrading endonuclease RelE of RelBE toxin-antitoxin system
VNRFRFTEAARADLRRIDREQAMNILLALTRFGNTGEGDVKQLKGSKDFRLRVGDYRVRMRVSKDGRIRIAQVKHRREAYR